MLYEKMENDNVVVVRIHEVKVEVQAADNGEVQAAAEEDLITAEVETKDAIAADATATVAVAAVEAITITNGIIWYVHPQPHISEYEQMILDGIRHHPIHNQITTDHSKATYCINYPNCNKPKSHRIIIDYKDSQEMNHVLLNNSRVYLKRSVVFVQTKKISPNRLVCLKRFIPIFTRKPSNFNHISYAIKQEALNKWLRSPNSTTRPIDIACFFKPTATTSATDPYNLLRHTIANYLLYLKRYDNMFKHYRIFVGIVGNSNRAGRRSIQSAYYQMLSQSKIVLTANPSKWHGDYRFFESFVGGSLVISDQMLFPLTNPFEHQVHCIFFDQNQKRNGLVALREYLLYYLQNSEERVKIATAGQSHAIQYHKTTDRINEIFISTHAAAASTHKSQHQQQQQEPIRTFYQSIQSVQSSATIAAARTTTNNRTATIRPKPNRIIRRRTHPHA